MKEIEGQGEASVSAFFAAADRGGRVGYQVDSRDQGVRDRAFAEEVSVSAVAFDSEANGCEGIACDGLGGVLGGNGSHRYHHHRPGGCRTCRYLDRRPEFLQSWRCCSSTVSWGWPRAFA